MLLLLLHGIDGQGGERARKNVTADPSRDQEHARSQDNARDHLHSRKIAISKRALAKV